MTARSYNTLTITEEPALKTADLAEGQELIRVVKSYGEDTPRVYESMTVTRILPTRLTVMFPRTGATLSYIVRNGEVSRDVYGSARRTGFEREWSMLLLPDSEVARKARRLWTIRRLSFRVAKCQADAASARVGSVERLTALRELRRLTADWLKLEEV